MAWHLYIVRCRGGELYTGIAADVDRRFAEHVAGRARAARYLRGRGPLEIVFRECVGDRAAALRAEHTVKRLSRRDKQRIVEGTLPLALVVAKRGARPTV